MLIKRGLMLLTMQLRAIGRPAAHDAQPLRRFPQLPSALLRQPVCVFRWPRHALDFTCDFKQMQALFYFFFSLTSQTLCYTVFGPVGQPEVRIKPGRWELPAPHINLPGTLFDVEGR